VLLTELDESCLEMLAREQRVIAEVISSDIYRGRQEARQADEATLRSNEWRAAVNLRDLTSGGRSTTRSRARQRLPPKCSASTSGS